MRKLFLLVLGLLFMTSSNFAQSNNAYKTEWEKADSLLLKDLPKSAAKAAESILKSAQTKKDVPNILKAQIFLLNVSSDNTENFYEDAIAAADKHLQESQGVEKAIWQCIIANYYWAYFQNNRYEILGRTVVSGNESKDFKTWDATQFMAKVGELYRQALLPAAELQKKSAADFVPLLIAGKNAESFKPTMFDVLAYAALDFFQNDVSGIPQPENSFELADGKGFLPANEFVKADFSSTDSNAQSLQALKIYQQLLAFHLQQADNPEGLVYLDLQRIEFVNNHSVAANKDSLYFQSLNDLATAYPKAKATAEVRFRIANFLYQPDHHPIVMNNNKGVEGIEKKRNLPEIKQQLQAIVTDFPGSEGAAHAQNLINSIDAKNLGLQVEEVYLPNQPAKALLNYKNREKVFLSVYRFKHAFSKERQNNYATDLAQILKDAEQPVAKWYLTLKGTEDLEEHSTEFKIDKLPSGNYFIVVSGQPEIDKDNKDNNVAYATFQVSELSVVAGNNAKNAQSGFWLLNRANGQPVANAEITFWNYEYKQNGRAYLLKRMGATTSGENGSFSSLKGEGYLKMSVVHNDDTLLVDNYYYSQRDNDNATQSARTFFFTDRSIYRPGQTIYFKGIMLEHTPGTAESHVLANQSSTVTFLDANGQKITSQQVKTNEFGSFSGTFKAPESGLTGLMSLQNESGGVSISVEEYKRPKFYVEFDTLKGDFALGHSVSVKGFAKAYAGNNIDGATVQYHVTRRARFPYFWAYYRWGQPSSPQKEMAHGTAKTNADGSFTIAFTAMPDKTIDPKTFPVFSYEISADVTDINGETRSGAQTVQVGYRSMQIVANLPEQGFVSDFDTIGLVSQNLNGVFIPANLQLTIQKLQFPGKIYRERLWPKPDEQLFSEAEFHQYFPDDEYENESDYHYWKPEAAVYTIDIQTKPNGRLAIPEKIWKEEGWYVLTFSGEDAQGREVEQKEYAYVVLPKDKQQAEKAFVVVAEKDNYQPGENAKVWLNTGIKDVHLLGISSLKGDFNRTGWIAHTVSEEDRGGMGFSWMYVYNNRVHKTSKTIAVPWTNKGLQLTWGTHRDKLLPGAQETWDLTIQGKDKEKVAAELLAGMYDASLDAFRPHHWNWDKLLPQLNFYPRWEAFDFGAQSGNIYLQPQSPDYVSYQISYPRLNFDIGQHNYPIYGTMMRRTLTGSVQTIVTKEMDASANNFAETAPAPARAELDSSVSSQPDESSENKNSEVQIRQNLQETAFFMPQLQTDKEGNVTFSFTMPEALTKWKFMAFTHTKDWKTGYLESSVQTQKELMVQPNLPRFLRQGDDLELSAKVVNLSAKDLNGTATLEILNALTNQPMALPFRLEKQEQPFQVAQSRSTSLSWKIHVPESVYQPVIIRIVAKAGNFSDGEENPLPVLSNRMLVTETLPLPVKGTGKHDFTFEKLLKSAAGADAQTLTNHALTVEFTGNPAWYAVQALPYLMDYPHECSEQTFSRFYANALAEHIVQQSPKVAAIFKQWEQEDTAALLSNLEKNQELKAALLEETPWVLEAKSETEQKHRIAMLFQTHKVAQELNKNLKMLAAMQLPDGAFPWFTGMQPNRYITQYILAGIGRLQHLGVAATENNTAQKIARNGLQYADETMQHDYDVLLKNKANLKDQHLSYTQVQYLYLRSFFLKDYPLATKNKAAFDYYKKQAVEYWAEFNPYMKAMLALALNRLDQTKTAEQIIASLKETAVHHPELGMYWKSMPGGYYWYQSGIEAQSLIIAAFTEIGNNPDDIADMKAWLLKNKQTSNWQTTTATSDAIYALLLSGGDWLAYEPNVQIDLGTKNIDLSKEKTQAGTGYYKETIPGKDVRPEMGKMSVTVQPSHGSTDVPVSWGAVYWQYFQDMDKVTTAESPLHIEKKLFIKRNTAEGQKLTPITDGNTIKVGDQVTVRIILKSDRDMDYVHLKDMRAAAFEPVDVISGYRFQNGLGYYQSTLDVSTNFFFDRLPKGTYILEYNVFVGQKGTFSDGISTVQCMYAPEFAGHSEGLKVNVE